MPKQFSLPFLMSVVTGLCLGIGLLLILLPTFNRMSLFGLAGVIGLSFGALMFLVSVGLSFALNKKSR